MRPLGPGPRRSVSPAVYLRRRLTVAAVGVALVIGVLSLVFAPAGPEDGVDSVLGDVSAVVVLVEPGDTLWGIARDFQPSGDHRGLVDALSKITGGDRLQAGQEIRIPADLLGGG